MGEGLDFTLVVRPNVTFGVGWGVAATSERGNSWSNKPTKLFFHGKKNTSLATGISMSKLVSPLPEPRFVLTSMQIQGAKKGLKKKNPRTTFKKFSVVFSNFGLPRSSFHEHCNI